MCIVCVTMWGGCEWLHKGIVVHRGGFSGPGVANRTRHSLLVVSFWLEQSVIQITAI